MNLKAWIFPGFFIGLNINMANIFTNFLDTVSGDLQNTNLKDYRHASKLFVNNFYRLAPKHGFLYFVRFRLNPNATQSELWKNSKQDLELGMLVKKCDLPRVTFEGKVLNVYNKKQPVYTKMNYTPINMTLHDDNRGLVREFWQMYYQFYSSDSYFGGSVAEPGTIPINPPNRYFKPSPVQQKQLTERSNFQTEEYTNTTDPSRYGLDVTRTGELIRSIEIYQLSRKEFFLHTIVNPKIRSWNMDTVASDSKNLLEHQVVIEYEGIYFGQGKVTRSSPDGWTDLHYDLEPSPIGGIFGKSNGGLYGPNGLLADGTTLFNEVQDIRGKSNIDQRQSLALLFKSAKVISSASNVNVDLSIKQVEEEYLNNVTFNGQSTASGSVPGLSVNRPNRDDDVTTASIRKTTSTNTNTNTVSDNPNSIPDGSSTVTAST